MMTTGATFGEGCKVNLVRKDTLTCYIYVCIREVLRELIVVSEICMYDTRRSKLMLSRLELLS